MQLRITFSVSRHANISTRGIFSHDDSSVCLSSFMVNSVKITLISKISAFC